mgnify:CR=1 FL=1
MDKGTKALEKIGIPRSGTFGAEAEKLNEWLINYIKRLIVIKEKDFLLCGAMVITLGLWDLRC